ncbi:MAG: hypothetical protein AAGG38_11890 [Planctomycetota bacterium]
MNPVEMRKLMSADPFRPFCMHFPSRTSYTVSSKDQAILMKDGRTIVVPDLSEGSSDILDVLMVERVETLDEAPKEPMWWVKVETNGY